MRKVLLLLALIITTGVKAQKNFWNSTTLTSIGKNIFIGKKQPSDFRLFSLQEASMRAELNNAPVERMVSINNSTFIIAIPDPQGNILHYKVVSAPVMQEELADRYPMIRSFAGKGIENPESRIRFDITPLGFHAIVHTPGKPTFYIDPVDKATSSYIVVSRDKLGPLPYFVCDTDDDVKRINAGVTNKNADDATLRTYRLAVTASGEYSQRWLTGSEPDDATRRAVVLGAINTNIMRVNSIMETDFGVRLLIIANNTDIIYLDASTDPFTSTDSDILNNQSEGVMNSEIGAANYDIGHLVTELGDYGKAGCIGCVCSGDNTKGRGFTSRSNWNSGNGFEEYILAHEMGHQFDANHTFTHDDDNDASQMEPGSGSTLMSYAGIAGAANNIQSIMDDYFHAISIQQVTDYIKSQACQGGGGTGNNTPTANAGSDYTIPRSTPFTLTGTASDGDAGDVLSFCWEQMDKLTAASDFPWLPATTHTYGPEFRSYPPNSSLSRTFPVLANILDGTNTNKFEKLPSVGRSLNFRFTVRDNQPGAGNNESDDMVVTIFEEAGPFSVTAPNTATTWCPGTHTVTWNVNGADALADNVRIRLSTDGGQTFPTVLVNSTINDGNADVTITCLKSTQARIKIEAIDNIFFDISDVNFTIGDDTDPSFTEPDDIILYKDANCNYDASIGITGDVTNEDDNCDNSLDATFSDVVSAGSCDGETIITRTWTLTDDCLNSVSKVQIITIRDIIPPTFTDPADITIYKDANCDHDASTGVTGDVTDEADNCDNTLNATYTDVTVPGSCMGEEIITRTWSLTDDCGNNTTHDQVITVRDTTRPSFTNVFPNPANIWPPNHQMIPVTINYDVADNCSDAAHITSVLTVTSNQPVNGPGDGNTTPDWIVIDDHHVILRAERTGRLKTPRVYTITITSTDDCGNVGVTTTTVSVSHDQGNARPGSEFVITDPEVTGLQVKATPNPSKGQFTIQVSSDNNTEKISLSVTDMYGRRMDQRIINNNGLVMIGNNYMPGTYIVKVQQGDKSEELKLIKL